MSQLSFSMGSRCIARSGDARRVRLLAAAAAVLQLMACGGSEVPAAPSSERAQPMAQVQAQAQAPAAAVPVETAAHGCVRQVNQALKADAKNVNADCLAGTYLGVDARGKDCALVLAASNGRFRFVERGRRPCLALQFPSDVIQSWASDALYRASLFNLEGTAFAAVTTTRTRSGLGYMHWVTRLTQSS